ncbi:fimbrial protein [Providencia hangzhouensis]
MAGLKDFTIKLVDCPTNSKVTVRFGGTRDTADNDILAINQAVGVANNVGVALFEKDAITQINV